MTLRFIFNSVVLLCIFGCTAAVLKTDNGLVYNFIVNSVNTPVDPCHDFASHICPYNKNLHGQIYQHYESIVKIQEANEHRLKRFWIENSRTELNYEAMVLVSKLSNEPEYIHKICSTSSLGRKLSWYTAFLFLNFFNKKGLKESSSCWDIAQFTAKNANEERLQQFLRFIVNGAKGIAIYEYVQRQTRQIHQLFHDVKEEFIELLKVTPWVANKKVMNKYIAKLKNVTISTMGTFAKPLENALLEFEKNYQNCLRENFGETICRLGSILVIYLSPNFIHNKVFFSVWFGQKAFDDFHFSNFNDGNIFMGSHAALIARNDKPPFFYGILGFIMSHELMHSFVFEKNDMSDLRHYWTQEAHCITEQTMNTCRNYNLPCAEPSIRTFEEDGADFNGVRIAWEVYQHHKDAINERIKKSMGKGKWQIQHSSSPSARDDQLFFYSLAAFFCSQKKSAEDWAKDTHSPDHVRINNMASQMDQFHEAFQCGKNDKIVRNKIRTCVQYGSEAPEQRLYGESYKLDMDN